MPCAAVLTALKTLGFACDLDDPASRLIACAGSTGCAKSLADTKADALALAKRLPAGVDVHLSGCPRLRRRALRAVHAACRRAPASTIFTDATHSRVSANASRVD